MTHCILQFSYIECFIKTKKFYPITSQIAVKFMQSFDFLNNLNVIKIHIFIKYLTDVTYSEFNVV